MDPANKSIRIKGIAETDIIKRFRAIETLMREVGGNPAIVNVEHVWSGPAGNRKLSGMSIIELSSHGARETSLKALGGDKSTRDTEIGKLEIARAQTSLQRKRNSALVQAIEALKKDPRCQGKNLEIAWKIDGSKNRAVKMEDRQIFIQSPVDLIGRFCSPFENVSV